MLIDSKTSSPYHKTMIKAGIIGATGYAGQELVRLLKSHPEVNIKHISSRTYNGDSYSSVFPNFNGIIPDNCVEMDVEQMAEDCDVIFLALPHGLTFPQLNNDILNKTVIIDLGADFRLSDPEIYRQWYGIEHTNPALIKESVYGLCEIYRDKIKNSSLIANPGCYTTCSILSLIPLLKEKLIDPSSIIVDAKSGVSGAGRSLSMGVHFSECNESVKAYKVAAHRHTPEIEQELSLAAGKDVFINFTPHLIPMNRGILTTSYSELLKDVTAEDLYILYSSFYENEPFIRVLKPGNLPETRFVRYSNYVDIGIVTDNRTGRAIIIGAIDNLIKGAAGQAVQNFNIRFGFDETTALTGIPIMP